MNRYFARMVPVLAIAFSAAAFAQTGAAKPASPAAASTTNAAATAPSKIGIVNIQAAIFSSNEGQRDFSALQKKFDPKRSEIDMLTKEVEDLKKQLSTTGDKLNEEARNNLVKQIDMKQKTLQRNYEDANNDFQAQQSEIMQRIGQKMMEVLDKYAKENGYSVVLDYSSQASPVLWAANSVDISQAVMEAYNQQSGVPAQPKSAGGLGVAPKPTNVTPKAAPSGAKPATH